MTGVSLSSNVWICCGVHALALQIDGGDVASHQRVVGGVCEVRGVLATARRSGAERHIRHAELRLVPQFHYRVRPRRRRCVLGGHGDVDADLAGGLHHDLCILGHLRCLDGDHVSGTRRACPRRRQSPARSRFCARCTTELPVCANAGANGESLPRSAFPGQRLHGRRPVQGERECLADTRSVNGATSRRIESSGWLDVRAETIVNLESFTTDCPPATVTCWTMSTRPRVPASGPLGPVRRSRERVRQGGRTQYVSLRTNVAEAPLRKLVFFHGRYPASFGRSRRCRRRAG